MWDLIVSVPDRCLSFYFELKQLILEYGHLFLDISSRTDKIYHDVDIILVL